MLSRMIQQPSFPIASNLRLGVLIACLTLPFGAGLLPIEGADTASDSAPPVVVPADASLSPTAALEKLMAGNQRYLQNAATHPDQTAARRAMLAASQHPFATILGCSDSRVAPEIIFDQGLGDLFVIRVAGNVLDDDIIGSIEYAVEHLHTPLILVLGHSKCGAVTAAVSGEPVSGHIKAIVKSMKPVIEATRGLPGDRVERAVEANVEHVVNQLKDCKPILAEHLKTGTLKIVGGRYDLGSGKVQLLD